MASFINKCCSYCCAACSLFVMAGISFTFLDLGNAISGSLFVNLGAGLQGLFQLLTGNESMGTLVSILLGGFMGLISILIFPIHWLLFYRPDDIYMAVAMTVPWILAISISAAIFAKSSREGLFIAIYLAIGYIVFGTVVYLGSTILLQSATGTTIGTGVIDGIFRGLTDLHPILAIILASLEGCLIGAAFGALIGSLKYDPSKSDYQPKVRETKDDSDNKSDTPGMDASFPYEVGEY